MENANKYLFRNDKYTYAILDGAAMPDLPVKLYEMKPPNVCLYRGELPPDLVYVAPYLVLLFPEQNFTKWLFAECWGKNWGIFAQTGLSLVGMRTHFRSLLTVYDETGKPLLFRFYDPRVFLNYVPTCNGGELQTLFGKVSYYFAETENIGELNRYQFSNTELKKTSLNLNT